MPDIFDQVAPDRPAPAAGGDIFDQVAPDTQPAPRRMAPAKPSDFIPEPYDAYQDAVNKGQQFAQQAVNGWIPGTPVPGELPGPQPLPEGLKSAQQRIAEAPLVTDPKTGERYHRVPIGAGQDPFSKLIDAPFTGGATAVGGAEEMAEPGLSAKASGLHKVIGGALEAASPLMVGAGIAAPVATAATVAASTATQSLTEAGLEKMGLGPEYSAVIGDLAGLVGGAITHPKTRASIKRVLQKRWLARPASLGGEAPAETTAPETTPENSETPPQNSETTTPAAGDIFDQVAPDQAPTAKGPAPKPETTQTQQESNTNAATTVEQSKPIEAKDDGQEERSQEIKPPIEGERPVGEPGTGAASDQPPADANAKGALLEQPKPEAPDAQQSPQLPNSASEAKPEAPAEEIPNKLGTAEPEPKQPEAPPAIAETPAAAAEAQPPTQPPEAKTAEAAPEPEPEPEGTTPEAKPGAPAEEEPKPPELKDIPPDSPKGNKPTDTYFGSGLGALEPLFRTAKEEGDALRVKRNEALKAAKAAMATPGEQHAGEAVRAYFTAERDLWGARANQAIDIVTRKVLPKIEDREALGIMREFRHRPDELQQMIDGTHPVFDPLTKPEPLLFDKAAAMKRRDQLLPVMRKAMRMMTNPTKQEAAADTVFTNIAEKSLQEGKAGGWLDSRWKSDEYVPHLLNPLGEGEVATQPSTAGRIQGKVGKFFGFGLRRSDPYPTTLHAVMDGIIPKTLDPSPAFTVHSDSFARARATHLLEAHLADSGLGKWGDGKHVPDGWVQLAAHSQEFKKDFVIEDPHTGNSQVGHMGLYLPEFIEEALAPITAPDWTAKLPGFAKLRTAQRGLKQAILGLSGFHLLTENAMAAADIGTSGMYKAFKATREGHHFLANERDLIASGGSTSIQGSTMDAYRGLKPGTIPTRGEVVRAYIPGAKQTLELADAITEFTFGNIQRRFKVVSFALHRDAWLNDNPTATREQYQEAKKGVASYTDGVFGGLHWENMGLPKALVEVMRALMLAPDWSGSNIALAKYAFDAPLSRAEFTLGKGRLAGAVTKEAVQARLARAFWAKQIVGGIAATQLLSLFFSQKLSTRPFQVFMGKDKDGREVFQNVFFRGSAGDAVNLYGKWRDHGLFQGSGIFAGSKAAPFTKAAIHVITGRNDLGQEITPPNLSFVANTVRGFGSLLSDVSPIPLVVRSGIKTMAGDASDEFLWSERMLDLFGPQAQHVAPEGTRMTKHGLVYAPPRPKQSILQQIVTGKPYESGSPRE